MYDCDSVLLSATDFGVFLYHISKFYNCRCQKVLLTDVSNNDFDKGA
jgi:hypothetical protein